MKTVRLFIVALFLTVAASAQPNASSARDGSSPTVYMISVQETDTLIPCEWRARAARNRMAMMDAVDDYNQTHRTGFQQPGRPQFLFAHKQNKYSLALGGFIALRTSYDFDGTPSATDFIPSSIPVPGDYASRQRLSMDASTSRIYLKGIANTRALGRVVVYVSTDFRGGAQGSYTPRRVPDFPVYFQYAWGAKRDSHFRVTGVVRDLYLHNAATGNNTSLLGWGVQASTCINLARVLTIYGNGVYGEGITNYIQDLSGLGYDFTPDPQDPAKVQTMPMWGWYGAARINILPQRLFISGGYSEAHIQQKHGYFSGDQYRNGQYIFGNIFYNFTSRCSIAAEYLYGSRENREGMKNHANRVSMQVQYNF